MNYQCLFFFKKSVLNYKIILNYWEFNLKLTVTIEFY